jgi:hypothetical protein
MIYYLCPDLNVKSAGIRILYRHVELLNRHGFAAAILHQHAGFSMPDVPPVPVRYLALPETLNKADIVVIPEGFPHLMQALQAMPLRRFAIALNWHYAYAALPGLWDWRAFGIERILTHSPFIADYLGWSMQLPCHVFVWGINPDLYFFEAGCKTASVVYISRKQTHVEELKSVLHSRCPRFITEIRWQGLDSLSEIEYARLVRSAGVFLNLSAAEGLPCSLLEAMRSGTLVAGYNSVGARDELVGEGERQNCILAANADYPHLARLLEPALKDLLAGDLSPWVRVIHNGIQTSNAYTREAEEASVLAMWRGLIGARPQVSSQAPEPTPKQASTTGAVERDAVVPFQKLPTLDEFTNWYSNKKCLGTPGEATESYAFLVLGHSGPGQGEMLSLGADPAAGYLALGSRIAARERVTVAVPGRELRGHSVASGRTHSPLGRVREIVSECGAINHLEAVSDSTDWKKPIRLLHLQVSSPAKSVEKRFRELSQSLDDQALVSFRATSEAGDRWVTNFCTQLMNRDKAFKEFAKVDGMRILQRLPSSVTNDDREETEAIVRFASRCKIFVLHHGASPAVDRPYLSKVNLQTIEIPTEFQDNRLAESRVYFWDAVLDQQQEFVGFATSRWDEKWIRLITLDRLHQVDEMLARDHVLAALPTVTSSWVTDSEACHPGIGTLIREMAQVSGIDLSERPTFWANNFICHQDVYRNFLTCWKKLFFHFYRKYGFDLPFSVGEFDSKRQFAYLAERFTMLYFSGRSDLQILSIPLR